MLKQFLQTTNSVNGKARLSAIEQTVELRNLIPPTVSYQSKGHLAVIGPVALMQDLAPQLDDMTSVHYFCVDQLPEGLTPESKSQWYLVNQIEVTGFLGTYTLTVDNTLNPAIATIGSDCFDVVLDLTLNGLMKEEVAVPGYYPVGRGYPSLPDALEEIPTLMGTFDKPKFFRLDNDKCAHSSRGIKGCDRCVDACPAGALTSDGNDQIGHKIQINPYLCQGVGTCATACPTEAIYYALPEPTQTQQFITNLLANYKQAQGENPSILFCSERHENYNVMALQALEDNVIPVVLEELPSVGIDTWLSALVNGASKVMFAASHHMPKTVIRVLEQEVTLAQRLLSQLNIDKERIEILYLEDLRHGLPRLFDTALIDKKWHAEGDKRHRLFAALNELSAQHPATQSITELPVTAPFGQVTCKGEDCTLCMACIAVCPTGALHNDGNAPQLKFVEQDCIQCGMCEKACPEQALSLTPRFNWDAKQRIAVTTIHQEPAAECTCCGKPFAPQSLIGMLQDKLRGHSHYADEQAIARIAMCEDCRVKDMFSAMAENPEQQLRM
ncbi:4Fe-4S dicluster domain-containing protein [Vibrio sp. SCSIO 43136]|uniref:4Fe-4S dicluster domain-containing protein n=1 Tax=Vibrio sp. SCSIO 43136 TaxID=2819101 RepID=UPI0020750869|nr:4Fe-4S dicluster domain-containing protein [Vibrio sp. SCSIO 43136]USD66571.1 4Fe-4S binding protein [Vibrio sp. SCSIO 43136]